MEFQKDGNLARRFQLLMPSASEMENLRKEESFILRKIVF